jgi:hypothetical protein
MLILHAKALGYEVAIGNTTGKTGNPNSLHPSGCAADLHLYIDGRYQRGLRGHKELGAYWLSLDKNCRWGGTESNDYNHYSYSTTSRW